MMVFQVRVVCYAGMGILLFPRYTARFSQLRGSNLPLCLFIDLDVWFSFLSWHVHVTQLLEHFPF